MDIKKIVWLICGLCVFMLGIKQMSKALGAISGNKINNICAKLGKNRFMSLLAGAGATAAINSSSAITAITVGLVDAGAFSVVTAAYIIMGSNIGTTVTGLVVALEAFDFSALLALFLPLGILLSLFNKQRLKTISKLFIGLGMLFLGLQLVGNAAGYLVNTSFFKILFSGGGNLFFMLLLGVVVTAIVQSSTAVNGLVIVIAGTGALSLVDAAVIILGTNIGTSFTAIFSAGALGDRAKQAAVIHIIFNVVGSLLFFVAILVVGTKNTTAMMTTFGGTDEFRIAVFNIIQNVVTAAIFFPFGKALASLSEKIVKSKATHPSKTNKKA